MEWNKFSVFTTAEAEDFVCAALTEQGIDEVEISDQQPITEEEKREMFIDFLPEVDERDHSAVVSFYLPVGEEKRAEEVLSGLREALADLSQFVDVGSGEITCSKTQEEDWINNWKAFFKPFWVDEGILIKPSWEEIGEEERKKASFVIELDPGTAFGTGAHETTRLCIRALRRYLKPDDSLLDAGCGSGILSIVGRKLGAGHVVGVDIDSHAVDASRENAARNQEEIAFLKGDILEEDSFRQTLGGPFQVVVANILADVIISLSGVIKELLVPGGVFLSSGILTERAPEVRDALLQNGFEILEQENDGDWCLIAAKRAQ